MKSIDWIDKEALDLNGISISATTFLLNLYFSILIYRLMGGLCWTILLIPFTPFCSVRDCDGVLWSWDASGIHSTVCEIDVRITVFDFDFIAWSSCMLSLLKSIEAYEGAFCFAVGEWRSNKFALSGYCYKEINNNNDYTRAFHFMECIVDASQDHRTPSQTPTEKDGVNGIKRMVQHRPTVYR